MTQSTRTDDAAIEALCKELSTAFAFRDECRQRLKAAEEDFDRVEEQLAALLENARMSEVRHDRWILAPKRTVTWRTPEDHKEDMLSLVREGAPSLVKETVNSSSLNAFLRREEERLDEDCFREFVFGNAARLFAGANPAFFKGTTVEHAVDDFMPSDGSSSRGSGRFEHTPSA